MSDPTPDPTAELLEVIVTAQRALGAARRRLEGMPAPTDDPLPGLEAVARRDPSVTELVDQDAGQHPGQVEHQNAGGASKHPQRTA